MFGFTDKMLVRHLSLYSTRTQNTWRRGLALGNAPDARFLRYPTQNIPTCWYILALPPTPIPDANPKICVTPDAKPRRQSVEYSWRWVPTQNAGVGHVYFFFFCVDFICVCTQREPNFRWNMGLSIVTIQMRRLGHISI